MLSHYFHCSHTEKSQVFWISRAFSALWPPSRGTDCEKRGAKWWRTLLVPGSSHEPLIYKFSDNSAIQWCGPLKIGGAESMAMKFHGNVCGEVRVNFLALVAAKPQVCFAPWAKESLRTVCGMTVFQLFASFQSLNNTDTTSKPHWLHECRVSASRERRISRKRVAQSFFAPPPP